MKPSNFGSVDAAPTREPVAVRALTFIDQAAISSFDEFLKSSSATAAEQRTAGSLKLYRAPRRAAGFFSHTSDARNLDPHESLPQRRDSIGSGSAFARGEALLTDTIPSRRPTGLRHASFRLQLIFWRWSFHPMLSKSVSATAMT